MVFTLSRSSVNLLYLLSAQVDVLVDKAPLQRRESTSACLVKLASVRNDMQADAGTGVNRVGVVGALVDKLVLLLKVGGTVLTTFVARVYASRTCRLMMSSVACLAFDSNSEKCGCALEQIQLVPHSKSMGTPPCFDACRKIHLLMNFRRLADERVVFEM